MHSHVTKAEQLKTLRQEILALQGLAAPAGNEQMELGLGPINTSFPNHTFPIAAIHEFISKDVEGMAASSGFITGLLRTLMRKGTCLWVSTQRSLFAPGLKTFGIDPDQVIFVDVVNSKKALWVIEEALKCGSLASVVGEIPDLSFTESRRLQLAVEKSRVTGFIHRHTPGTSNVACVSRWHIRPVASVNQAGLPGIGMPAWNVELQKIRNGKPGSWLVNWSPEGFKVVNANPTSMFITPARKTG